MNGQEYLNQISASNRPTKQAKLNLLSSRLFIGGMIFVGILLVLIIIGAILGGNKGGEKIDSFKLYLHMSGTSELIQEYQDSIKSSKLRGSSSSLYSVLDTTSKELTEYLKNKYEFKNEKNIDKEYVSQATSAKEALGSELFEAKINGNLDRVYAHKMAYEIELIASEENKIIKETKNDTLKQLLTKSYESLDSLYNSFNDFSETNN